MMCCYLNVYLQGQRFNVTYAYRDSVMISKLNFPGS